MCQRISDERNHCCQNRKTLGNRADGIPNCRVSSKLVGFLLSNIADPIGESGFPSKVFDESDCVEDFLN